MECALPLDFYLFAATSSSQQRCDRMSGPGSRIDNGLRDQTRDEERDHSCKHPAFARHGVGTAGTLLPNRPRNMLENNPKQSNRDKCRSNRHGNSKERMRFERAVEKQVFGREAQCAGKSDECQGEH